MLEITTDRTKNRKKLLLDGHTYMVRRPGAGESLDLSQFGKEVEKLDKRKDDLTPEENQVFSDKSMQSLRIILSFFDALGNEEAQMHLKSIDPEELMGVVKQVFEDTSVS
jgi:hypothetical protein